MKILFVGINPHFGSFRRGVPFSNNKTFWYLLNKAGIVNESMIDLKSDKKLKTIYDKKFNRVYRLGFVNVINRPSRDTSQLKRGEEDRGVKRIQSLIKSNSPKIVCFIGKITFEKFSGSKEFDFGWQNGIFKSKVFVMHFPIRGRSEIRIKELKKLRSFLAQSKLD
jgi:TDG/mug DNA glycosylase family protein